MSSILSDNINMNSDNDIERLDYNIASGIQSIYGNKNNYNNRINGYDFIDHENEWLGYMKLK